MNNPNTQIILNFELRDDYRDTKRVQLNMFHDEFEFFEARTSAKPVFEVELPHAFHETALMDSQGWRNRRADIGRGVELGHRMWGNLPEPLRNAITNASDGSPLRVAIASHFNGLDDIPWEWLCDDQKRPIAVSKALHLIRLVPSRYASPPLTIAPPLKVMIVLTNPKDERLLQSGVEVDLVTKGLYGQPDYEVKVVYEPRLEAMREQLNWMPNIIHYIGHAGISGNTGCLIFHNDVDGTRWLTAAETVQYLPSSVKLLCLSTCVTAENYQIGGLNKFAHSPSDLALPTTIVNQYTLDSESVGDFWSHFYSSLIRHDGNVVEACHDARTSVSELHPNYWDWASFSLIVRDGIGHPFKISASAEEVGSRYEAEIQAQWSAKLANDLLERASTLEPAQQKHWETSIAEESARLERFEKELEG